MEKLLNPYDKECMRMAMLKHEETFREQVYELHRLYQIQKILMKNIANSRHNGQEQTRWNFKNSSATTNKIIDHLDTSKRTHQSLDLERPPEDYNAEIDGDGMVEVVDESELELTLGPSSFIRRMRTAAEAPLPSDSGPSFSSSSTGSSHIKRTATSGSHQKITPSREDQSGQKWRLDMPISNPSFLAERKNTSDVEEQHLRSQDRLNNPAWLFQVLSLNMT